MLLYTSMLFNLLLANIISLLCFFFFFCVVSIPTGAPITVGNEAIEMLPLVADKTIKTYQNSQKKNKKKTIDLLSLLLINSLSWISAIK